MVKNKKAFTLVELLAVIVILAVILVIASILIIALCFTIAFRDRSRIITQQPVVQHMEETPTVVEETPKVVEETPTATVTEEPEVTEEPAVSVSVNSDPYAPNDQMIYDAMDSKQYKTLYKLWKDKLNIGIIDVTSDERGFVVTYIIDNTDARFEKITLNNYTSFTEPHNIYGDSYPIIYFSNGVPTDAGLIYGRIGESYAGRIFSTDYIDGATEITLTDCKTGEVVTEYVN